MSGRVEEKSYREVIEQMNLFGRERQPFFFAVDYSSRHGYIVSHEESVECGMLFDIEGVTNCGGLLKNERYDKVPQLHPTLEPIERYAKRFEVIRNGLLRGDSFLTNLTVRTPLSPDGGTIDMERLFATLHAKYKVAIPGQWICFSPEIFVKIEPNGRITSYPMKGTIDASIPNAEQIILDDYKEHAEHNTIVDLIRNDLNRVAQRVGVKRFRYIDRVERNGRSDILQVSSEVEGFLGNDFHDHLADILHQLLPAGSITGAPKEATVRLIAEAEQNDRGYYTGVAGYYDGKSFNSCVLIRFIEECIEDGVPHYFFHSGGGITINSVMEDEYREVMEKVYLPVV